MKEKWKIKKLPLKESLPSTLRSKDILQGKSIGTMHTWFKYNYIKLYVSGLIIAMHPAEKNYKINMTCINENIYKNQKFQDFIRCIVLQVTFHAYPSA